VAGEAVVLKPNAQVGFSTVLRGGGQSTISSWWGCGENVGAESLRTSGVRRRALAPVLAAVVAAPAPPAVFPSHSAFAVGPATGHHPSTGRGCAPGFMVRLDPAASRRVHAFRVA
jgi:hypothetical protein